MSIEELVRKKMEESRAERQKAMEELDKELHDRIMDDLDGREVTEDCDFATETKENNGMTTPSQGIENPSMDQELPFKKNDEKDMGR